MSRETSLELFATPAETPGEDMAPRDSRALAFERLAVERMPGIVDRGFGLDGLAAGINIIHGPNASGKTTTARALESLLWPRAAAPPRAILGARFHLEGREWSVEVDGQAARYQRAGQESAPPALPPGEARDRYHLSLHELLSSENRSFADEIVRESAGGYDIARAAASIHTRPAPSRRGKETDALDEARARLRDAYADQERLRQDERRLDELSARLEEAEAASQRARLLERAVEYAEAVAAEAEAGAAVAAFPEALALLRGDEADRLDQIRRRLAEAERALEEAEAARREAEAELRGAALGAALVDDTLLDSLRARRDSLRALEQAITAKALELEGARKVGADELRRIGEVVDEAALGALDVVALDELADFADEAGRLRAAQQAAEARIGLLSPSPAGGAAVDPAIAASADHAAGDLSAERAGKGVLLLQQWLRSGDGAGPDVSPRERRLRTLGTTAAALLAVVGLVLLGLSATGASPGLALPAALLALLAAGALLFLILRRAPVAADPREVHRREYERLGLERPRGWTPEGVAECLDRLELRRAEARVAEERTVERGRVERELEAARAAWAALTARREGLASRFGVAPELDPVAFHALANRISRWQDATNRATQSAAELEHLRREYDAELATAAARLAEFGYDAISDLAAVTGAIEGLARRVERQRHATADLRHAENRAHGARKELAALGTERRAIFERLGLEAGEDGDGATPGSPAVAAAGDAASSARVAPEPLIREWCSLHASYGTAVARRQAAAAVRQGAYERLSGTAGYDAALADRDADELRDDLATAERHAGGAGELRDEIAAIRTRLDLARRGHAVEDALAEVGRCEAALGEARDRDILGVVGHTLVAYLQRATRDEHRPAVFHRARELFTLITRGRYRLDFDDGDVPAFRAFDETTRRGHALDELSSATRVQLLLAVRIAFVESQESGVRLPLIFDETLGNSDDDRAAAIMEATIALAAEGRQIFYFTAQPDEVGKWRGLLERAEGVEWRVIDLAAVRRLARHETSPPLPVVAPPEPGPPAPAGLSHEEYGRILLVPGVDRFADLAGVHLWHLVEDCELLHRLLALRFESWGALRSLVENGGGALLGEDQGAYPRIRAAARALEAALSLARIGRGRPVDRDAIEGSGAVTETFMERVVRLLEEVEGDAARLLEAIEGGALPRFQASRREQLRDHLEEHGHLDPRAPIGAGELRARVVAQVAGDIDAGYLTPASVDRIIATLDPRSGS